MFRSHPVSNPSDAKSITYPGVVIDNNDPLGQQRIKCRISALHQGIADADIPWCLPIKNSGSSTGDINIGVPAVGSIAAIEFPEDDNSNSYWKGVFTFNSSIPSDFTASFPQCYGRVDANNNLFIVDLANNSATMTFNNGTTILITATSVQIVAASTVLLRVNGDADISATGAVNIKGTTVNLNPSSTAADGLTTAARGSVVMPNSQVSNMENY